MARDVKTIRIESILGGHSSLSYFPEKGQYLTSLGVTPEPNGYVNFQSVSRFTGATLNNGPRWITVEPVSDASLFIYDASGSIYTGNATTLTGLGDLNDGGSSSGNGMAYYDNYIYFARDTTVARYGPLNGSPSFTDDYWTGTLGKTALSNTTYPNLLSADFNLLTIPNHFLKTGKDGRLYIADVVGDQGVLHYICTKKTTVEGDTDNGSTYNAIDFPFGYWPVSIENYGEEIAIACTNHAQGVGPIKIIFWDPTNPTTYSRIIDTEIPDTDICGLINANGILYLITAFTNGGLYYTRVSRYVGGYSFEQVCVFEVSSPPLPGAITSVMNQIVMGVEDVNTSVPAIIGVGLPRGQISDSVYCIQGSTASTTSFGLTTAIYFDGNRIRAGWQTDDNNYGLDGSSSNLATDNPKGQAYICFGPFRVGQRFKIKSVSIPMESSFNSSSDSFDVYAAVDEDLIGGVPFGTFIGTVGPTEYGVDIARIVLRPNGVVGEHSLAVFVNFSAKRGTMSRTALALPITVEIELLDD